MTERRVPRLQCGFPSMKAKGATKSSEIVVYVQDPAAPIFEAARLIENHTTRPRDHVLPRGLLLQRHAVAINQKLPSSRRLNRAGACSASPNQMSSGWIDRHKLVGRNPSYRTESSSRGQRRSHGKRRPRTGITASSENSARAKLETRQLVRLLADGILARWK